MERDKKCSFFGHREIEITVELKNNLKTKLEKMILEEGYGVFCFGGFGDFDNLCWQVITELKQKYPHIKRIFHLYDPRHQQARKRPKYLKDTDYEEFVYLDLEFDWWYQRIYFRNIEIIKQSDFIIFYVKNSTNSGAYKAYQYAIKKKKNLINIAEKGS